MATRASERHLFANKGSNIGASRAVDGQPSAIAAVPTGPTVSSTSAISSIAVKGSRAASTTVASISTPAANASRKIYQHVARKVQLLEVEKKVVAVSAIQSSASISRIGAVTARSGCGVSILSIPPRRTINTATINPTAASQVGNLRAYEVVALKWIELDAR
jgi:hypothetical protein